jgi:glycosyltransferase involved in cell wall biosynthesis
MRILTLTAGAANMYCGSCLRDNTLARALRRLGHDVVLLPLYTPTRVDEDNVSEPLVLFGGISVYLQQHLGVLRRTPATIDRLWDRPAVIRAVAGRSLGTDPAKLGALTVSMLRGEHGYQRKEVEKLLAWARRQAPFDVVVLPNSLLIALAAPLARALGRPVVCTLQGEDLFLEGLPDADRRAALALISGHVPSVTRFAAVSGYYATFMASYLGLPPARVDVVPIGIDAADFAGPRPPRGDSFTVGYLARVDPAKGLKRLCGIYRRMRHEFGVPAGRLLAGGFLSREHHGYLAECRDLMTHASLGDEFQYVGELTREAKIAFLEELDVLCVPSPYAEPKGLFLLEAMAAGVPVVQPRLGAYPEILHRTGGGLLVDDSDEAVAGGLAALWRDPARRDALGRLGTQGVHANYSSERMAAAAIEAYGRAVAEHAAGSCGRAGER